MIPWQASSEFGCSLSLLAEAFTPVILPADVGAWSPGRLLLAEALTPLYLLSFAANSVGHLWRFDGGGNFYLDVRLWRNATLDDGARTRVLNLGRRSVRPVGLDGGVRKFGWMT